MSAGSSVSDVVTRSRNWNRSSSDRAAVTADGALSNASATEPRAAMPTAEPRTVQRNQAAAS